MLQPFHGVRKYFSYSWDRTIPSRDCLFNFQNALALLEAKVYLMMHRYHLQTLDVSNGFAMAQLRRARL